MPEEPLGVPPEAEPTAAPEIPWTVMARNERVNRSWQELVNRAPTSAVRCYNDLRTSPMTRQPGRVYPLKYKAYKGVWEYEVIAGDRLYYVPDPAVRKVVVYYAGAHPKQIPRP